MCDQSRACACVQDLLCSRVGVCAVSEATRRAADAAPRVPMASGRTRVASLGMFLLFYLLGVVSHEMRGHDVWSWQPAGGYLPGGWTALLAALLEVTRGRSAMRCCALRCQPDALPSRCCRARCRCRRPSLRPWARRRRVAPSSLASAAIAPCRGHRGRRRAAVGPSRRGRTRLRRDRSGMRQRPTMTPRRRCRRCS